MILEISGGKSIKVEGDVQVNYTTGKVVIYNSETVDHLILNPDYIMSITINVKRDPK